MRKRFVRGLAYAMCATLAISAVPPWAVYAENDQTVEKAVHTATPSDADRDTEINEEVEEESETGEEPETSLETEEREEEELSEATPSEAVEKPKELPTILPVKIAAKVAASSSLGDIWDAWAGKTSFEFLSGSQGEGTKEKPFLIKNREQLMGLSELTAMGMMVPEAEGAKYAGDYSGCYFALGGNIDLQGADWIPIGFYRDSSENAGEVPYPFSGEFDGKGYTIKNLKLTSFANYNNVGLFGAVTDARIHDVTIIPDSSEIKGKDRTGVVAGYAEDSKIQNVTVKNAYIRSTGIAGGIAGEISGTVIENVTCEKVMIDATNGIDVIYVGGIAGIASDSYIVDSDVSTGDGTTARIQGTGYIGGIVGYQNAAYIYNNHVSGTIGGYHSTAIGGFTGRYAAGKLKVARFEGTIGNSQLGSLAREGTFIGTRQGAATNFNYVEDVAYLFADSESKISANVCGSEISDDNDFTYAAHVGYWHTGDLYYTLVQGGAKKAISDRYFYEELEDGILTVMDEESGDYTLDHFAPNSLGRPVRGYLLNVNQIDTVANGQNFYDIATLEVRGSSQYSKPLDKEHRGAIAAGTTVNVTTAPKNTDTEKFQMEGTPTYTNGKGVKKSTTYSDGSHAYTFSMPQEDLSVSAVYKKVAVSIKVEPEDYSFAVVQTRTGNRKSPVKTTEIKNKEGKLIARYINGVLEQGTEVQPVNIKAIIDANNDVEDGRVKWSIDDPQLISLAKNDDEGTDGYSAKSASLSVSLSSSFFTSIIEEAERIQSEGNYQYKIQNTIYGAGHQNGGVAVLTAQTRPSASFEGKPCTANSRINVTFQIIDNTLVATEGAALDKQALDFVVTRTLTGDRTNPQDTVTVTAPQSLTSTFTPDFFSRDEVTWTSSDPSVVLVSQSQEAYREASVLALKDSAWIRNIMATDNGIRESDKYAKISGFGSRDVTVTVNGKDKLGNQASAVCQVSVRFVTNDLTRIIPEGIVLNQTELTYGLGYEKAGDISSDTVKKTGFESRKLSATVLPEVEDTVEHKPYDRSVTWTSSDPEAVRVDQEGNVTPVDGAPWIKEALIKAPYQVQKSVVVTATTEDGQKAATCTVTLNFQAECIELDRESENFNIVLTKTGKGEEAVLKYQIPENKKLNASIYSASKDNKNVLWSSSDESILTVDKEGNVTPVVFNEKKEVTVDWIKEAMKRPPYTGTTTVTIYAATSDGKVDSCKITLNFQAECIELDRESENFDLALAKTGRGQEASLTWEVLESKKLNASIYSASKEKGKVLWSSSDESILTVDSEGNVTPVVFNENEEVTARWIKEAMKRPPYTGTTTATIYAATSDGKVDSCKVTINFQAECIELDRESENFGLALAKTGRGQEAALTWKVLDSKKLNASIYSASKEKGKILWSSSDESILTVDSEGNVTPVAFNEKKEVSARWIKEAMKKPPYAGTTTATIYAATSDGKVDSCKVTLTFQAECIEADRENEKYDLTLTKTGKSNNPVLTWEGLESKKFNASIYSGSQDKDVQWRSSDAGILTVDREGNVTPVVLNEKQEVTASWIKEAMKKSPFTGSAIVTIYAVTSDGKMADPVTVTLNFKVVDNTTSGSSSGGGGGKGSSGGGGAHSVGVTTSGNTQGPAAPVGAVTGTWTQVANGKWIFASSRTFTDEWAYISNPYATGEQEKASWFRFDKDGFMVTGWQTDPDGNTYYLKTTMDGTQGQMLTGWQYIPGEAGQATEGAWYFFNPASDGTRGKLLISTVTPDGYSVNEKGQWVQ